MVLFCHVTTRVEGDAHQGLLREKGGTGFPYLVFMDAAGEVIAKQGDRSVEAFEATRQTLAEVARLERLEQEGDEAATAALLIGRLRLGQLELDAARQAAAAVELNAEQRRTVDDLLVDLEVTTLLAARPRTQEERAQLGAKFAAMLADGRAPTGRPARSFYSMLLPYAESHHDPELYAQALAGLEKALGDLGPYRKTLERYEQTLERLRADKQQPKK